jgi:hypothetical protein
MSVNQTSRLFFMLGLVVSVSVLFPLLIGTRAEAAGGANLIVNGDFSEWDGSGSFVGWDKSQAMGRSEYGMFPHSEGYVGSHALRITGGEGEGLVILNQRGISTEGLVGKKLKISAWYRGTAVDMRAGANNFLRVEFWKMTDEGLKAVRNQLRLVAPAGTTDWVLLQDEFEVPVGTEVLWVSFYLRNASGTIKLSNLEMTEVQEDPVADRKVGIFYVSPKGDDDQSGSVDRPWATLGKAAREAIAGDVIIIMPGTYAGYENILAPKNSGTAAAPITFRAAERRKARLAGTPGADRAIVLDGVSHIRIEGLEVFPVSSRGLWLLAQNVKDIHLTDMHMERSRDAVDGTPFLIRDSEDIFVRDSTLKKSPFNMAVIQCCKRVLFEGNAISYAGHSPLQFYDGGDAQEVYNTEIVLRGNVFNPTWGRAFEFLTGRNALFENNIIIHSLHGGRSASEAAQPNAFAAIYRFNRVFRNWGNPIVMHPWLEVHGVTDNRIYHNVFDRNSLEALRIIERSASIPVRDNVVKNNIFHRNDPFGEERQVVLSRGARHVVFEHNALGEGGKIGFSNAPSQGPDDLQSDGEEQFRDNFRGPVGFLDAERYDHRLSADSPLRDAAVPLTFVLNDGQGRVLAVEDVRYFYDGFGIAGEQGDLVSVGEASRQARVVKVDVASGTLELDRKLSWQKGDAVSLSWSGAAPDMGALEHGDMGRVSVFVEVDPFFVNPGQPVTMRAHVYGSVDPVSFEWRLGDGTLAHGQEITHTYDFTPDQLFSPEGFPIRVRVTDREGAGYVGVGFVEWAPPKDLGMPLMHTTFDADDDDAWWIWYKNRPTPVEAEQEINPQTGQGILRVTNPGGGSLPLHTNPAQWDIDRYPFVYLRYRMTEGTPLILYLRAFDAVAQRERRVTAASVLSPRGGKAGALLPYHLVDDGEWHVLLFDARMIREVYPGVTQLRRLGMEAPSSIRQGDTYWLDEAAILSEEALQTPLWQKKLAGAPRERPRQMVYIESPLGESARGEHPIKVQIALPPQEKAVSYTLTAQAAAWTGRDEKRVLYEGETWPGEMQLDTCQIEDGMYALEFVVKTDRGHTYSDTEHLLINNWATLIDDLLPPSAWFTTVERLRIIDRSEGWQYADGEPESFFDDADRLTATGGGTEHLTWRLADLRRFEVTAFFRNPKDVAALNITVSADGNEWLPVTCEVQTQQPQVAAGWFKVVLSGETDAALDVELFRVQWDGEQAKGVEIQLGRVELVGLAQ